MSFDAQVIRPNRGKAVRVDVSIDNFATVAHRWSDVPGLLDGTNQYSRRVVSVAPIRRALGQQRIASSSTTTVELDNADGALDWLCGEEGLADAAKARFRIYLSLYDHTTASPTIESKMLGEFVLYSWPTQDDATVTVSLSDDMMGRLGAGLVLPTIVDWQAVGTTANNPIKNSVGLPSTISLHTPIQLAFGEDWVHALPHLIPWGNNGVGDPYHGKVIIPLYATTDLSAVSQSLIQDVRVEKLLAPFDTSGSAIYDYAGRTLNNAATGIVGVRKLLYVGEWDAAGVTNEDVWYVEKSPTITKGGRDFQIVYLVMSDYLGDLLLQNIDKTPSSSSDPEQEAANLAYLEALMAYAYQGGYPEEAVNTSRAQYRAGAARALNWWVKGVPLSQRTNPSTLLNISHSVDVLRDLVAEYSDGTVNTASAARVKAGNPWAACSGVVLPWTERSNEPDMPPLPKSLRQVLTAIAQSCDLDIFVNWSGEFAFSSEVMDFTTATQESALIEIGQKDIVPGSMQRAVPSNGERGAPFNRVYLEGGKENVVDELDIPFQGPFDIETASITPAVRVIEACFQQGWRPYRQQALNPFQWRNLDASARSRVRFRTHRGALRLDLGDYFKLNWDRGPDIGAPYTTSAVFQLEAITYAPEDDSVELEALWRNDTVTERQYLLDDETLLVRTKPSAASLELFLIGAAAFATTTGGTINFTAMGVTGGDILVLRDSSQAADVFSLNRAIRIPGPEDDFTLQLDSTDTSGIPVFPTVATIINADWSIVRGATTYPTAISHPADYPSGGTMYGKVTAADGTTSDLQTGNRLING